MRVSIVIPTKNRAKSLSQVLSNIQLLLGDSDLFEVLVYDNSDKNCINNPTWFTYLHDKEKISITENWDRAIEASSGDYIIVLGDDDFITEDFVDFCATIDVGEGAYRFAKAYYYFNDSSMPFPFQKSIDWGRVPRCSGDTIKIHSRSELERVIKSGCSSMYRLPSLYHGLVSRRILNEIKDTTGTYFPGPSPDMASGVAVASLLDSYVFIDKPLVISGKGNRPKGSLMSTHAAPLDDVFHIDSQYKKSWGNLVPRYWLAETVWFESVRVSLEKMDNNIEVDYFALNRIMIKRKRYRIENLKQSLNVDFRLVIFTAIERNFERLLWLLNITKMKRVYLNGGIVQLQAVLKYQYK